MSFFFFFVIPRMIPCSLSTFFASNSISGGRQKATPVSCMIIVISRKTDSTGPIFISSFVTAIRSVYWSFISPSFSFFLPPSIRPSVDFRLSQSRSLVSLRASPPSRWEMINLEYPACWKRTEWKIFPFTVMFREFFSRLAGTRLHPRTRPEISDGRYRSALSDLHPHISKSLFLVLLKFKNAAHNFATSLSRTDRTKFIRHFSRDEENNEKLRLPNLFSRLRRERILI